METLFSGPGVAAPIGAMTPLTLLGVQYAHLALPDGSDLYLTRYGLPFAEHLHPEAWMADDWFERNREKLVGTSTVYRVRTKTRRGLARDLVVKWCRVGERVPADTATFVQWSELEFNSPYEEFALVMEMRDDPQGPRIRTHKPLGIYVPAKRHELWQLGRFTSRIERKKQQFREIELDIRRQYILIYEWVKGVSIPEATQPPGMEPLSEEEAQRLADRAHEDLETKGFRVLDFKPAHVILRHRRDGTLLRRRDGTLAYALVDFELLQRTPEREQQVATARRAAYLQHQKDRFAPPPAAAFPPHLRPNRVCGVDYVFGHTESTGGRLWVVGRDPALFDYFLPERWRKTRAARLSDGDVWKTKTKDRIQLVWKVSRVGERPEADAGTPRGAAILAHGFNSPFEEFAIAMELAQQKIATTYPRAIYMTGQERLVLADAADPRRYEFLAAERDPDGEPVLRPDRNYIAIWGYWNGTDAMLADRDVEACEPVNLDDAVAKGLLRPAERDELLAREIRRLTDAGWEDVNPNGGHLLLSRTPGGDVWRDAEGFPLLRWCNLSLFRRRSTPPGAVATDRPGNNAATN